MKQLVRGVARKSHEIVAIQALLNKMIRSAKGDKINLFIKGKLCIMRDFD